MQAVVFADRHGRELAPLCDNECPALLPLANRPLLEYTLEDLASAGITEILLVVSDNADRIERHFAQGAMWGVNIRYLLSRGEESPQALLSRCASSLRLPFLALRGDVLRSPLCKTFLKESRQVSSDVISAFVNHAVAGVCLVRALPAALPDLAWPQHADQPGCHCAIELGGKLFAPLDSLRDYHRAALAMVTDCSEDFAPVGRKLNTGLSVGRLSQVAAGSHDGGIIRIGDNTKIHPSSRVTGPAIIGHHCYVDRGVEIHNSVVLPGTYVGENLQITNAIVAGNYLIRVDHGTIIPVPDPMLLSDMEGEVSSLLGRLPESVVGMLLGLLSLPLWPLALLLSLLQSPRRPLCRQAIVSNRHAANVDGRQRRVVHGWRFATAVPLLRHLPMLWLVIRGDLRLFGSTPLSPQRSNSPASGWDPRRDSSSAGLLGPAQLLLADDAPEEEIRLTEIDFVAHTGCTTLLTRLLQASVLLLSPRAWLPGRRVA